MAEKILHTPLCDTLGIKYPILLAGMGGASTPELAAAVSNAGGVGILEAARRAGRKDIYPGIAGQSVGLIKKVRPAREVFEEMVQQAVHVLSERFSREVQFHA